MIEETLYFYPSIKHEGIVWQCMAVAATGEGHISIIMNKAYKEHLGAFVQFQLTEEETLRVIEALYKAISINNDPLCTREFIDFDDYDVDDLGTTIKSA